MKNSQANIENINILEGCKFIDDRGWFREIFIAKKFKKKIIFFVSSKSKKNVLRGLHLQTKNPQSKFVSVLKGKILDVAVDLRKNSKNFGKSYKTVLSAKNCKSFYIPKGFAHGFLALEKENIVLYGCDNYRDKNSEVSIKWNDPKLKINWGIKKPKLSKKDRNAITVDKFLKIINEEKN